MFCIKHKWSDWEYKTSSLGYYDEETWYERVCEKCGKIEQQDNIILKKIGWQPKQPYKKEILD